MKTAICPGSFDPITLGHIDIIERAAKLYDKVVVGIAVNKEKKALFTAQERLTMTRQAVANLQKVKVELFDCLLVEFARRHKAQVIVKGLRAISDFEHEFQMAHLNKKLDPDLETVFMMASHEYMFLSSSAVKEIASYGGLVEGLVSAKVAEQLSKKLLN
jgi:pantetheine-phosphate adenylyltransferase